LQKKENWQSVFAVRNHLTRQGLRDDGEKEGERKGENPNLSSAENAVHWAKFEKSNEREPHGGLLQGSKGDGPEEV